MNKKKFINQLGVSMMEVVTASSILALSIVVFMTLQANQEDAFTKLRKFDRAAYAVELMFEEMAAVYNPVAVQYGSPRVKTTVNAPSDAQDYTEVEVTGMTALPEKGDQVVITGVGGRYRIISNKQSPSPSHDFDADNNVTLRLERSDIPADSPSKAIAADAVKDASITFKSNALGSLDPYDDLDMSKFEDTTYLGTLEQKVRVDCENWGALLKKILGPVRTGDQRLIDVTEVDYVLKTDLNNDGDTDDDGESEETIKKKQVTITLTQDGTTEKFRRLFLSGT